MNIAILISNFPPGRASGSELQAQTLAARLSADHRVTVITSRDPVNLPEVEELDGYTVRRFADATALRWIEGSWRERLLSSVPRTARELRWKVVAKRTFVRQIRMITPRPDVLLCFSTETGTGGVAAGRRLRIPAVVWIRSERDYQLDSWMRRRVAIDTWARASGVCVQTAIGRAALVRELERVSSHHLPMILEKLEVIGNGVNLPERSTLPADGPVLSVGRLIPSKGMDVVIEACAKVGRPLVIAGRGPEQARLEERASALGAEVHFAGFVDRDALDKLYCSASVVVLASQLEGLPNVLLEAMAYGRPVVATACGGIPELITDGINGLLVPMGDPIALAAALDRLSAELATAIRIADAARATAEGFAWERIQSRLENSLEHWRDG